MSAKKILAVLGLVSVMVMGAFVVMPAPKAEGYILPGWGYSRKSKK